MAHRWLAQDSPDPEVVLVGLPWAPRSPGLAMAPLAVRDRLRRFSTYHAERGTDFARVPASDLGNWPVSGLDRHGLAAYLADNLTGLAGAHLSLFLGGEDGITPSLVSALEGLHPGVIRFSSRPLPDPASLQGQEIVVVGAHGFAGSAESHEEARREGAVSIGIDQIEKEGVRMTVDRAMARLAMAEAIHVSVDLDVLDQAHVPACPGALPGGLTVRQLGDAVRLCAMSSKVRTMDFVGADADHPGSEPTLDALCHTLLSAVTGYAERSLNP